MQETKLVLLEKEYLFNGALEIVQSLDAISGNIQPEDCYVALNVIYKATKNPKMVVSALSKHKKKLLKYANKVTSINSESYIAIQSRTTFNAIQQFFDGTLEVCKLKQAIEPAIMIQRMLSKAKEIFDNQIVVDSYRDENDLVGLGQDIYDGEVEINEWFRCGIEEFKEWELFYSPLIFSHVEDKNIDQEKILSCERCHQIDELHLKTSIRSFRADKQCQFIDALLDNDPKQTSEVYQQIDSNYPICIIRDYSLAKKWVRAHVRGPQRSGVLACSSAQRLKSEAIYVPTEIDVKNWFLAPSDDLRSPDMLEVVASEFKVQGLEIDWAIVCWDADLRRNKNGTDWDYHSFWGTKWNKRNKPEQKRYLVNSYRVLLTRAHQGMVLFVSKGVDPEEYPTRDTEYYDGIYKYLVSCGIQELQQIFTFSQMITQILS